MDSMLSTGSDGPSFVILDADAMSLRLESLHANVSSEGKDNALSFGDFNDSSNIQQKVEFLVKENKELKETLIQNNLAMKTQYDTLSTWQQDVLSTHQSHKAKFSETRDMILKLREENARLKIEIDNLSTIKEEVSHCGKCDILNKELIDFQKSYDKLEAENILLLKERSALREEYSMIRARANETLPKAAPKNCSLPRKYSFEGFMESQVNTFNPHQHSEGLNRSQIGRFDGEAETFKKMYQDLCDKVERLNVECEKGLEKNKTLSSDLQNIGSQLEQKDLLLKSAINELNEKREQLQEIDIDRNEIGILKAKVELYETDYHEERAAREALAGEKAKLEERIRILEARINEMESSPGETVPAQLPDQPSSSTQPTETPPARPFLCPVCGVEVPPSADCNQHVNDCLDGRSNIPTPSSVF